MALTDRKAGSDRAASRPKETASSDSASLEATGEPAWADAYAGVVEKLGRLSEHERTLVVLRYINGHSMAEIAEMTGRPIGSVTKQLSRAIAQLRKWLVQNDGRHGHRTNPAKTR